MKNYIITQTETGIVIVDQHAAHERLVYERSKQQSAENGIESQGFLTPEIISFEDTDCARLLEYADLFSQSGLVIEPFGRGQLRFVPFHCY